MSQRVQKFVFTLYEQRRLRNWFYTLAFAISVPVGFRFAILAWEYGDWFDKPLSVIAGLVIGITAVVTLLRVWAVPPRQTMQASTGTGAADRAVSPPNASEMYGAAKRQAAVNRGIARGAAALGSTRGWPFQH